MTKYPIEETCPHCNTVVRTYRRKFPKGDIKSLVQLRRAALRGDGWTHIKDLQGKSGGGDFAKYRYWGLITEKELGTEDKRSSGYWKLTGVGKDFVEGATTVHSHVILKNGEALSFDGKQLTMKNLCHASGFSYDELMGRG